MGSSGRDVAGILRRSRGADVGSTAVGLFLLRGLRLERAESVLVVAHAIGVRSLRLGSGRRPGRAGASGLPATTMITSMPNARPTISHVCMLARQDAAGTGRWSVTGGVPDAGQRCARPWLTVLAARTASARRRAPDTRGPCTLGTTYVPLCTWKFTTAGLPSFTLVERGQFLRVGLDVRELAVVPDGADEEGLRVLGRAVDELQPRRDTAACCAASASVVRRSAASTAARASLNFGLEPGHLAGAVEPAAATAARSGRPSRRPSGPASPVPLRSLSRNEYTVPLAVTRFRFVAAPSLAGLMWARLCVALMTQKSLSPQITSRISSPSGRTIIVVYRMRVWSGMTASARRGHLPHAGRLGGRRRADERRPRRRQPARHRTQARPQTHATPPYADAASRSRPAWKPYSRNMVATRSLSTGVFV